MMIEQGDIGLENLKSAKVFNNEFGYTRKINDDGTENIVILPSPFLEDLIDLHNAKEKIGYESNLLLHSKSAVSIKHRTAMLNSVYNSFKVLIEEKNSDINKWLTLQTLYLDMVTKLGAILEDFAGMCYACEQFNLHKSDIAKSFLGYSDPRSFYSSFSGRGGKRKIKQIFNLPASRGELQKIFNTLDGTELLLLEKSIKATTDLIFDNIIHISSAIIQNQPDDVTYYDMYNKIKHGFSPIYPFMFPLAVPIQIEEAGTPIEGIISEYFFESVSIMHNKLPGQRTEDDNTGDEQQKNVVPTITYQSINLETAQQIINVASDIEVLYIYLVNRYLAIAEEDKKLSLLISDDYLTLEERDKVKLIIEDETRYI